MPKRVVVTSIGLTRDGKTVYPTIGKAFDFSAAELEDINRLQKATGNILVRKPVNEDPSAGASDDGAGGEGGQGGGENKYLGKTVPELKAIAAERNIDLGEATKKDDILAVLEAADKAAEDEDL